MIRQDNGTTWIFYYGFNDAIFYEKKPKNGKATRHQLIIDGKGVVGSTTELAAALWQDSVGEVFYTYLHDLIFCFPQVSFFSLALTSLWRSSYLTFFDLLVANESFFRCSPNQPRVYYIDRTLELREAVLQGTSGDKWLKGALSNQDWKTGHNSVLASLGTRELAGETGVLLRVFFNETANPGRFTQATYTTAGKWEKAPF